MNPPLSPHHRSRRASTTSLFKITVALVAVAPVAVLPSGYALPTGGQVASGNATIAQAGSRMTINQTSRNAIVNWQSFNLAAGEQLRLNQTGGDAAMLARVTGSDPSKLLGSLKADGKLFLINPKGILVGQGAVIDTSGFIATTLDVSDKEFLGGGAMTFKGDSAAGVANYGQITAHEGNVMLFAHTVTNAGSISAPKGGASLAAGTEVYLANPDDTSVVVKFNLPQATAKTGVDNSGVIAAAQAELKAAGGSIYDLAINQSGIVRATGVENKNGRIILTTDGGTVGVSGSASARNADGGGGEILVGGDYHGQNAAVPNASRTVVTASASLDASATTTNGVGGRVIVWSDDATHFLGNIDAHGTGGGFAEVSGKHSLAFNPVSPVNVGVDGTLVLDPDALVISAAANSGTSTSGTDPFTFGASTEPANLNVTTLQNQLAASNVILDTSNSAGSITFNAPVTWTTNNTLTAKAGGSIFINANLTGGASSQLVLNPGKAALPTTQGPPSIFPKATLASSATITVGTLTYGANPDAAPAGYTVNGDTGAADFQGNLNVGTLAIDLSHGSAGVSASGSDNAIGTLRTIGTGDLSFLQVSDDHGNLDVQLASSNASAPQVRVTTPGRLTLLSGTALSFGSPTDVILASTESGFVNQAGAAAIGTNGRFLIYTNNTGFTAKGGLVGTDEFSRTYAGNPPENYSGDTTSRFLYRAPDSTPWILSYVADGQTRTYGATNPSLTFTASGLRGGDTLATAASGAPTITTTAQQNSGVGTYAVNISRGTLDALNYGFAFTDAAFTVTAAPLTITADSVQRGLGLPNPQFTASYSGLVLGEDATVVNGLQFSTTADLSSPRGTYPIQPSGASAANYAITFVPGTLTLANSATLTISANNASRLYGAADPSFSASITGFQNNDPASIVTGLQFSTSATQTSGIGNYTITPFGATAPGYDIAFVPGTLEILRAPLTITAQNGTRLYGDANPAFAANYVGLVLGESASVISGLTFSSPADARSGVGTYAITATGASAANYAISYGAPGELSVTKAPLAISADNQSRLYGATNPALTFQATGLKNGDTITTALAGAPAISTTATASSDVGGYVIAVAAGSLSSSNYSFSSFADATLTVNPAPLTITAKNVQRTPVGADPVFDVTYAGLVLGQDSSVVSGLSVVTTATGSSPVGSYPITPQRATARNYAITFVPGTLTITDTALLTISANNASRLYGAANPTFTAGYTGFIGADTAALVSGLQFATTASQASGVGTYTITPFGATAPGYAIAFVPGTLTIDRAPLTIFPLNAVRTYGDANPDFGFAATGLVNGDTSAVVSGLAFHTAATQASNAGSYGLTVSGGTAANYAITTAGSATLTVNPAVVTVRIDDQTRRYGDADPAFTYTVSGLKNSDSPSLIEVNSLTSLATADAGIGDYGILANAFSSSLNYTVNRVLGTLTITPRPLTITADHKTKVYGDANPALTATFSGLASFDTASAIPNLQLSTTATQTSGVSDLGYGILVNSGLNRNYAITYEFGSLSITPASLSLLAPPDVSRVYGRADPALPALNFGGLKNSDTIAGLRASYVDVPAPTADVGSYTYGVAIDNPNYRLSGPTTGTFRIDAAPLDVQIDGLGRTYGDANPSSYTFSATGLAFGQTAASVLSVTNPTDQTTGVGKYNLQAKATSKNYYVNSTTGGILQINPRLLTFSIDNIAKYYGDQIPDFTYNFGAAGLAPSDNITAIISDFKTAVPVGVYTDVGLYRIDPVFKANPNYLVSWTPAYLAILPRPIELTINNAIAFGNDKIPAGFTTGDSGVDLVHAPTDDDPGFKGFTISASNLPANVLLKDVYPSLQFSILDQNTPVAVATAVDLTKVFPKTTATAPQATTDAIAPTAATNATFSSDAIVLTSLPPIIDTTVYAIVDGNIVKNPPAAQQVLDRFAAKTFYVAPATYANSNYVVTKVTNGVLTMKADPDVVRINLEIALKKDQRAEAQKEFDNGGKTGAFGLPPDMFSLFYELLGRALNDALKAGDTGPGSLYYEINGGPGILFTGDQLQVDKELFWLADIHTNPLKQAELLPGLLTYVMDVAGRDPKTWSAADSKLITVMTPFVQKAQEDYANKLKEEKQKWLTAQNSAKGAVDYMMGTTDEYSEVIENAITDVAKSATDKMSTAVQKLVDQSKDTLSTNFTNGTFDPNLKVFVVDSVRVAGAGAGAAATGALVKFAIANSEGVKGINHDARSLQSAFNNITDLLKKSVNVTDIDIAGMSKDAATKASKELQAKLSDPDVAKEMDDAYKAAYDGALKAREGTLAKAEEAGNDAMQKVASKYANPIMEQVASDLKSQATKQLETQALYKSQEAYNQAVKEGKSTGEANQIAEFEKQEYLRKNTTPENLESKAMDKAQVAFEQAVSEGKSANEANEIAEFTKQDFMNKATQAKTVENEALDHSQQAFEKALSEGKSATEAGKIADRAQQDFVEKAASDKSQDAYQAALKAGKSETEASKIAETVKDETLGKVKNLLSSGSTVLEEEAENPLFASAKTGAKVAAKAIGVTTEDLAGAAAKGVVTGIKSGAMAARLASFTESLALGPGAVVELAIQVAIQAGSSAAERADQDARLNALINNGSKPVDLHAMATDQDGRAVMMMGLLAMFSQSGNSSGSVTVSNP